VNSRTAATARNDLLAALPQPERDRIVASCVRVRLTQDEIVAEPGEPIEHVFFPVDSFVSLQTVVDGHDALAVDLIGSESMLGASLLLGDARAPLRARVQGTGSALRMTVGDFQRSLSTSPVLKQRLLRQLYRTLVQLAQTAACASYHVVEARLACWLLMIHDRAHGDRFYLTHDQVAHMLGVRRSGVTTAAGLLQTRKLIDYARGHIVVSDRQGLEQAACGCYQSVQEALQAAAVLEPLSGEPAPLLPAAVAAYHVPGPAPMPMVAARDRRWPQSLPGVGVPAGRPATATGRPLSGAPNRH
jgi:CRP-like cAMP-binding protein